MELGYTDFTECHMVSRGRFFIVVGGDKEIMASIDPDNGDFIGARFTEYKSTYSIAKKDVRGEAFFALTKDQVEGIFKERKEDR
jgi:hypothetical protein